MKGIFEVNESLAKDQNIWGCPTCRYGDRKAKLGTPMCQYFMRVKCDFENNKCLTYKERNK